MLYLVECHVKDTNEKEENREYLSLFPDGTEASDKKAAVSAGMDYIRKNFVEPEARVVDVPGRKGTCRELAVELAGGRTICYYGFAARPLKWKNYPIRMSQEDVNEAFGEDYVRYLQDRGIIAEMCLYGIRVKTGVDTWIVDIRAAAESDAQADIYHKNNWNQDNCSNGRIPGYHRQSRGRYSMEEMTDIMISHGKKWKPGKNDECYKGGSV